MFREVSILICRGAATLPKSLRVKTRHMSSNVVMVLFAVDPWIHG